MGLDQSCRPAATRFSIAWCQKFPWLCVPCALVRAVPGRLQSTPAPSPAPQPCGFQSHFLSSLPLHIPTPRWGITPRAHL